MSSLLKEGCVENCPGCRHRSFTLLESLKQKEDWLHFKLAPWEKVITPLRFLADEEERWHYRDKVCLNVIWNEVEKRWAFGLIRRKELIEVPECPVHTFKVNRIMSLLAKALPPPNIFPLHYFSITGRQTTLVLKCKTRPPVEWLTSELEQALRAEGVEGLWLHLNMGCGKRVLTARNWFLLFGKDRSFTDDGLTYGPASFQQVLPSLYRQALDESEKFLTPGPRSWVVDLYCGLGASMKRWLNNGAHSVGVELNGDAISCAKVNALEAVSLRGLCQDRIPQIKELTAGCDDILLFVNPPRTGIEFEITDWIGEQLRPKRIAYLSCSAGTLRKDLDRLTAAGYEVNKIVPLDFFPQTHHVETLVLLSFEKETEPNSEKSST